MDADAKHDLYIDYLFLERRVQYPQMALPRLLDWIFYLVLCRHNLIQMDLIVKEVIKLEPLEWLEHLLYILLQSLYQGFVLNPQHVFD